MKSHYLFLASIAMLLVLSSCNGNITNPMAPLNPGSLTADIQQDGTSFISSNATVDNSQSGFYSIVAVQDQGVGPANEVHIRVPAEVSVPYTISAPPDNSADFIYYDVNRNLNYEANADQGSFTITITQTSPTLEGSFSAQTVCNSVADSVRTLVNGVFNASY